MRRWLAALAAVALLPAACKAPAADAKPKPDLYLITPLPLVFGEGFGLGFAKADVIVALEKDFAVKPVDLPSQVPVGAALMMAQPRALPAEELVKLDEWVRGGGKLLLLADPMLEWPSERPLGDRLRPPVMFADTGLLQHWGLRLDAPEKSGLARMTDDLGEMVLLSPGQLVRTSGSCVVDQGAIIATCAIGKGQAIIVADADWIDVPRMERLAGHRIDAADRLSLAFVGLGVLPLTE